MITHDMTSLLWYISQQEELAVITVQHGVFMHINEDTAKSKGAVVSWAILFMCKEGGGEKL